MRRILERAGFTDIEENPDGTFNAKKDGKDYFKMYPKNINFESNGSIEVKEMEMYAEKPKNNIS